MIAITSLVRAIAIRELVSFQQPEAEATKDCIAGGRGMGMVGR
jgi:hypothetical protein